MAGWLARSRINSRWSVQSAVLAVSLVASGYLLSVALRSPSARWVGWCSLLPLFLSIRVCRPAFAALAGGLWGLSLYLFSVVGANPTITPSAGSLALLTALPAVYAWLGAWITRWSAYSPLALGVGWVALEFALQPLGLRQGLLATTQAHTGLMAWLAPALGYTLVSFLVAVVNASLVSALAAARLGVPRPAYQARSPECGTRLVPQTCFSYFLRSIIRPSQPRAPPPAAAAMT